MDLNSKEGKNVTNAAQTKLRHERREIKLTLRGLQDDPLLQESFTVLRSIQRRYQPLCRTVCLSSNLTDDVIAKQQQNHTTTSASSTSSTGHRRLSAAEKECVLLRKAPTIKSPINGSWDAVEAEGLKRLLDRYGIAKHIGGADGHEGVPAVDTFGTKRSREAEDIGEPSGGESPSLKSILNHDSIAVAQRLHGQAAQRTTESSTLPNFHALYDYVYGTNVADLKGVSGKFLVHVLQKQLAMYFAGLLIEAEGNNMVKDATLANAATLLTSMENLRLVPFFHEATRVASFAIVACQGAGKVANVILVDPTIEVAERHLPQLLDSFETHAASCGYSLVVVSVLLTHVPRDTQIGVAAVRQTLTERRAKASANPNHPLAVAAGPSVHYVDDMPSGPRTVLVVPLSDSNVRLTFTLVPSVGYSSDSGHIELGLATDQPAISQTDPRDENDNPTSLESGPLYVTTIATFLSPTVGLDGLSRLDYLTADVLNNKHVVVPESNSATAASDRKVTYSCILAPTGVTDDDLASAAREAAGLYHRSLVDVGTRYLCLTSPQQSSTKVFLLETLTPTTSSDLHPRRRLLHRAIGDGLVLFASRGGYNCSNGMLEAHWATTVADLKHQQHTKGFWNAVMGTPESVPQSSNKGSASSIKATATTPQHHPSPIDTFMAYIDKQQVLLDPLLPPMPKLLGSERNYQLNLGQVTSEGNSEQLTPMMLNTAVSQVCSKNNECLLIAIDVRPHLEYLAHPSPNTANVPFLPLFAASGPVYGPSLPQHSHGQPPKPYSLSSNIPAPDLLGAKKPEQWLGSFVDMREGDGLLLVLPDAEWTKIGEYYTATAASDVTTGSGSPALLSRVAAAAAQRQLSHQPHHAQQAFFVLELHRRMQHVGVVPYLTADSTEPCRVWIIGLVAYSAWLAKQQSFSTPNPFGCFSAKPYDHRALRLNTCEDLGVMNLKISMMQTLLTPDGYVDRMEPPDTLVVDIRTQAEFRNGSHRNSVHYAMWELLADWRREYLTVATKVDQTTDETLPQSAEPHVPRWTERFGTKALDAGITALMASARNPKGPSIALYCAGGYRSHITASLLRAVPLSLNASGLLGSNHVSREGETNVDETTLSSIDLHHPLHVPTYYDVAGGAFQLMTQRPDLWHVKDRSVICVS